MNLKTYELINPSDPYTFKAPNIEIAGLAAAFLSTNFGAKCIDEGCDECSPILFGWDDWMAERGIDDAFISAHYAELADAFESFLIGSASDRRDVEEILAALPSEKREQLRASRQDRRRSSLNRIGERAYKLAEQIRQKGQDSLRPSLSPEASP